MCWCLANHPSLLLKLAPPRQDHSLQLSVNLFQTHPTDADGWTGRNLQQLSLANSISSTGWQGHPDGARFTSGLCALPGPPKDKGGKYGTFQRLTELQTLAWPL